MMKKLTIPVVFMALVLCISSCKKEDVAEPKTNTSQTTPSRASEKKCEINQSCNTPIQTCGTTTVQNLVTCQNTVVGTVSVANNATNLYVTYTVNTGWRIQCLHLYVGDTIHIPVCANGPNVAQFPYTESQCGSSCTYTFTIPLSSCLGNCFIVAAEADVYCSGALLGLSGLLDGLGATQTAWAAGTRFTGRCGGGNSTYFNYCKQSCNVCILPPNLLFSGEDQWPNGATSVTVGGYTYTVGSMSQVLAEPTNDAQSALFAVATLKLYGSSISPTSAVTSASTVAENWLSTLGQLTSSSSFTAPANVEAAISTIQSWEASNYCQ